MESPVPLIALLPLLLPALVPAALPGAPGPAPALVRLSEDPVERLRLWLYRQRRAGEVSPEAQGELHALVGELRILAAGSPGRHAEIDLALLDLFAFDVPAAEGGWPGLPGHPLTTQQLAAAELEARLRSDAELLPAWLAEEVLGSPAVHDAPRRRAAAALLAGRHAPGTRTGLLGAACDRDEELRALAVEALVGWRDPAVHAFFLERLRSDDVPFREACRHLTAVGPELGPQALARVRSEVGRLYVSGNWRDAARAGALVGVLDAERAVPMLIEALGFWNRRGAEGRGSKRIQHELVAELQRISGRSIGPMPDRWSRWWSAVQEGRIELAGEHDETGTITRADFFGLRPATDRVVFVVDHSGSMGTQFGTGGRTRFDEAVEQLFRFLETSGEGTRFGLVVFNHQARNWRGELTQATPANLSMARSWLTQRANQPDGGTALAEGVRTALLADRDFTFDHERLEADTVVVLCDGESTGPRDWLRPVLRQATGPAQLRFQCVRIGFAGDGVLETLAQESGGDCVRVDG